MLTVFRHFYHNIGIEHIGQIKLKFYKKKCRQGRDEIDQKDLPKEKGVGKSMEYGKRRLRGCLKIIGMIAFGSYIL